MAGIVLTYESCIDGAQALDIRSPVVACKLSNAMCWSMDWVKNAGLGVSCQNRESRRRVQPFARHTPAKATCLREL